MTFEEKMKIVINNYFKKECSVNTSIREAFEKGFRIGASKVQKKHGKWIKEWWHGERTRMCSICNITQTVNVYEGEVKFKYCPYCGAKMDGEE